MVATCILEILRLQSTASKYSMEFGANDMLRLHISALKIRIKYQEDGCQKDI